LDLDLDLDFDLDRFAQYMRVQVQG
jgi:hypothetical protein